MRNVLPLVRAAGREGKGVPASAPASERGKGLLDPVLLQRAQKRLFSGLFVPGLIIPALFCNGS